MGIRTKDIRISIANNKVSIIANTISKM